MSLLVSADDLRRRRTVATGSLHSLAASLAADLAVVIARPLYVPDQKALLSREGGRCPRDGTLLDFDPFSPRSHNCPQCGSVYKGELHDRFWIYWYQLWLAERAVHGALLGSLGIEPRGLAFAASVLDAYCDRYPAYPNVDNALGPTRPFFSTYLESIWVLQLCVALDLIEAAEPSKFAQTASRSRDLIVEPSLSIIRSYDEGMSNRQVWNNAAMMAACRVLARGDDAESIVWAESGLAAHLSEALLPDGTWYEGENYHLFAHRGLWYGVAMAERAGVELPGALVERFNAGFATPFLTALPDFTLPSRRDSQYAISLRQWRFAEMCELGLARGADRVLVSALSRLYDDDIPRGVTGRARSSAEAERNLPATTLSRADLGWRSLLLARAELPPLTATALPSVLLEAQGIGVFRRDAGRVYVALDYGHSGGGHGHPDRLNLLLSRGETRWLDDYGTGSYVDPSLHWYRSTLAHNAPMTDGRSQPRVSGSLIAYDERGAAGVLSAAARIGANSSAIRTIIVMPDYLVDQITWSPDTRLFDLPLHVDLELVGAASPTIAAVLEGSDGLEDGFRFLRNTARIATISAKETAHLRGNRDGETLDVWLGSLEPFELWRATAPGAPGRDEASFIVFRSRGSRGALRALWSWSGEIKSVELFPNVVVTMADERHEFSDEPNSLRVTIVAGNARSTIDLAIGDPDAPAGGDVDVGAAPAQNQESRRAAVLKPGSPIRVRLGEESYRQSEESWDDAGNPTAEITFENEGNEMVIEVAVLNVDRSFIGAGAANRLDNEHADVNGAGVQLYLRTDDATAAYVLVPRSAGEDVAIRPVDGWGSAIPVTATWTDTDNGYVVEIHVRGLATETVIDVDVIVNEKPANRERRRGQLVLSGGAGEFVYLRGDRHDPERLIPLLLTDG